MNNEIPMNGQAPQVPPFPQMSLTVYDGKGSDRVKVFEIEDVLPHQLSSTIAIIRPGWTISLESHE